MAMRALEKSGLHSLSSTCSLPMASSPMQALEKSGVMLGNMPLRVLPSKTAIVPVSKELMPRSQVGGCVCVCVWRGGLEMPPNTH